MPPPRSSPPDRAAETRATAPAAPATPHQRPWRAPTLERLPLAETRNGVGINFDGAIEASLVG